MKIITWLFCSFLTGATTLAQIPFKAARNPRVVEPGGVRSFERFHPTITPFPETLMKDGLGSSIAPLGDLDGNGVIDVAIGAWTDHVLGECALGAVWVTFLRFDGKAIGHQKIREGEGGFHGDLRQGDMFGYSSSCLGDLDGDGTVDLAVGAPGDDELAPDAGAVWILFLNPDGTVKAHTKIHAPAPPPLAFRPRQWQTMDGDRFGSGLAGLGDIDANGTLELAVGAKSGIDKLEDEGVVWILSLASDGTILSDRRISQVAGNFTGDLDPGDDFGRGIALLDDKDGNGTTDLAVGAPGDDDGTDDAGAVWILFLDPDIEVISHQKISVNSGVPAGYDRFGESVASIGDLDDDGITDLAVGAPGVPACGALWILHLLLDGTARDSRRHSGTPNPGEALFEGKLEEEGGLGSGVAALGDPDNNGIPDVIVGAPGSEAHLQVGQAWTVFLRADATSRDEQLIGTEGWDAPSFLYEPSDNEFGEDVARLGDLEGDGTLEIAVGQPRDSAIGPRDGALWILSLDRFERITSVRKISRANGFSSALREEDEFGSSVELVGDVDGNGFADLAVGAPGDSDGDLVSRQHGAVWIVFLGADGAIVDRQEISRTQGGLVGPLGQDDRFGESVAAIGDRDGDGVPDIAVGAPGYRVGNFDSGAVWILFLNADGTVKTETKFMDPSGFGEEQQFGRSVESLGGNRLAVGAPLFDGREGSIWICDLHANGNLGATREIGANLGGFQGGLSIGDQFGSAIARVGDLDANGVADLAVGAPNAGGVLRPGELWILFMEADGTVRDEKMLGQLDFPLPLSRFGSALGNLGDIDADGIPDLLLGKHRDEHFPVECETSLGALWILRMDGIVSVRVDSY